MPVPAHLVNAPGGSPTRLCPFGKRYILWRTRRVALLLPNSFGTSRAPRSPPAASHRRGRVVVALCRSTTLATPDIGSPASGASFSVTILFLASFASSGSATTTGAHDCSDCGKVSKIALILSRDRDWANLATSCVPFYCVPRRKPAHPPPAPVRRVMGGLRHLANRTALICAVLSPLFACFEEHVRGARRTCRDLTQHAAKVKR